MKPIVAALALILAWQGRTLYEDKASSLRITNYTEAEGSTEPNGDFTFAVKGNPAIVESRLDGLKIESPSMDGVLGQGTQGKSFIRTLHVLGGAVVTMDSTVRFNAASAHAKQFNLPVPPSPNSTDKTILTTDHLNYAGEATGGVFTIEQPFAITFNSDGRQKVDGKTGTIEKAYHQVATVNGKSGRVTLNPGGKGFELLQTGQLDGPVTLHIERTETTPGAPASELTIMDGTADRISFDLPGSHTITLAGNVKITGENPLYRGTSEGDKAVITLDETMHPTKVRITGNPTKSTAKEKGSGGGI
jgi:hypothetical protein